MSDESGTETTVRVDSHTLKLTSLDKLLYPATETTKGEVLHYYASVAERIQKQFRGRPVTRVRFPHGVQGPSFFEKNAPSGCPTWITRTRLDEVDYPLIESTADLTYFANLASLEFHTPQWRMGSDGPENPDRLVIDLDPGAPAGLDECARIALVMKDLFDSLDRPSVPVTSGSKGMQIYSSLDGTVSSERARELARSLAEKLAELSPEHVVARMTTSLRPGKVFLDWSQNTAHKTTITPWSLRGRTMPTVATPRTWDEIEAGVDHPGTLDHPTLDDVLATRLSRPDPMDALA